MLWAMWVQSQAEHKAQLQAELQAQNEEEWLGLLDVLTPGIKVGRAAIRHTTCAGIVAWGMSMEYRAWSCLPTL